MCCQPFRNLKTRPLKGCRNKRDARIFIGCIKDEWMSSAGYNGKNMTVIQTLSIVQTIEDIQKVNVSPEARHLSIL